MWRGAGNVVIIKNVLSGEQIWGDQYKRRRTRADAKTAQRTNKVVTREVSKIDPALGAGESEM
jgi:hypothetical protein